MNKEFFGASLGVDSARSEWPKAGPGRYKIQVIQHATTHRIENKSAMNPASPDVYHTTITPSLMV